jgi:predicted phosphate transport protein (TIGR00153 family)
LPRDERFFELFEQAIRIACSSADTLLLMLTDFAQANSYRQQISDLEHAGDSVIHEVTDKLNRTFVTPFDPEDIRAISNGLDDITDYVLAASERLALYHVETPLPSCAELCKVLVQAVSELKTVVTMLRDLGQKRNILERCIEVNRLENVGDKIYREILSNLFLEANPMELIRWKEIIDQIEQAIDQCEDLAEVIESIVVKHT